MNVVVSNTAVAIKSGHTSTADSVNVPLPAKRAAPGASSDPAPKSEFAGVARKAVCGGGEADDFETTYKSPKQDQVQPSDDHGGFKIEAFRDIQPYGFTGRVDDYGTILEAILNSIMKAENREKVENRIILHDSRQEEICATIMIVAQTITAQFFLHLFRENRLAPIS
ncbi:hypothetical protein CVT25_004900 [Psilocybe cyanescens]|uniref:Uncharacterized protein n=1 Tax=Psilocybe cyanescens TaxID=93625 RepID=A0A409X290_PSICY|nr:hypothetical protein CVT25_004900 [Psilocybe cyanescens]